MECYLELMHLSAIEYFLIVLSILIIKTDVEQNEGHREGTDGLEWLSRDIENILPFEE